MPDLTLPTATAPLPAQPLPSGGAIIRRSELACPAYSLKMMAKAAASPADEVVLDLEDGCAVSQKVSARATLIQALTTLDFGGKIVTFRPNNLTSRYCYRDLIEVVEAAGTRLDGLVLPKVNDAADVLFADRLLSQIEANVGLPVGRIRLEALIESAEAVLHAERIARATPRLSGLLFGLLDFAGDIGASELGEEQFFYYHYAKAKTIAAARAAGLTCMDGVTLAIRDDAACARDARMAARMGFDGKWAIHPAQIAIIHAAFTPTREEAERALGVIEAYERASATEGIGAIVVGDEMVDAATLRIASRRLSLARKAGLL